jgi:two-component system, LytTR family, response regulator LytT
MDVLIIEDEIIIAAELSQILESIGYNVVGMAVNYSSAIAILNSEKPDIAIIDIHLNGSKTGVDVGKYINENNKIPFIFLTSNTDKNTIDLALETKPNAYLVKPFDKTAIYSAIALALQSKLTENLKQKNNSTELIINNALFVKVKDLYEKVPFENILYFKSDKNYIDVFTTTKNYIIRSTMASLLKQLPTTDFIKIHKSYAVNTNKINAINHEFLHVENAIIPISAGYRDNLLNNLKTFS